MAATLHSNGAAIRPRGCCRDFERAAGGSQADRAAVGSALLAHGMQGMAKPSERSGGQLSVDADRELMRRIPQAHRK